MKHIVGFSGGADSQATALWCRQQFGPENVLLLNSDAGGNEHPLTTEFLRHYSETIHPIVFITPLVKDLGGQMPGAVARLGLNPDDPLTFDVLAQVKGRFPASQSQFCTTYLKMAPIRRWMREHASTLLAEGYCRYVGVRADESENRKDLPPHQWDDYFDCDLYRPILTWTKAQVFAFLAEHGEEVNPLYRMGFSRVGCAPCINANKEDIRAWAARAPEMIDKVREWEKRVGRTFFPPMVPGMALNFVDDVVKWSKTVRGGRQLSLPLYEAEAAKGGCSSKYGLCE